MPDPLILSWAGGELEIRYEPDVGAAVVHARDYELGDHTDSAEPVRADPISRDSTSYILSTEEARQLFNWLGVYLHKGGA